MAEPDQARLGGPAGPGNAWLLSCFSHYETFSLWFGQNQSPNQFPNSLASTVGRTHRGVGRENSLGFPPWESGTVCSHIWAPGRGMCVCVYVCICVCGEGPGQLHSCLLAWQCLPVSKAASRHVHGSCLEGGTLVERESGERCCMGQSGLTPGTLPWTRGGPGPL